MERIIKGYWNCPYCEEKDIDGLVDYCPKCGVHKPEDVKYHLPDGLQTGISYSSKQHVDKHVVTDKELSEADIGKEECDGNHPEWVCNFCGSLNNWADQICRSCGSKKEDATKSYFSKPDEYNDIENITPEFRPSFFEFRPSFFEKYKTYIILSIILLCTIILGIGFMPYTQTITVDDFSWQRVIDVEEYKTVQEDDWQVPDGGRVYDTKVEIQSYQTVLDHYETVTETKSRQVLDHYETSYSYSDNGNGTFSEHTSQSPVYRTEYYTETHQEPVYRQDPVYATKYYYDIERWVLKDTYTSSGNDKSPYWNTEYLPLTTNERESQKTEHYQVMFDNGTTKEFSYDMWKNMKQGDQFHIKTCRLGIIYSMDEYLKENEMN